MRPGVPELKSESSAPVRPPSAMAETGEFCIRAVTGVPVCAVSVPETLPAVDGVGGEAVGRWGTWTGDDEPTKRPRYVEIGASVLGAAALTRVRERTGSMGVSVPLKVPLTPETWPPSMVLAQV